METKNFTVAILGCGQRGAEAYGGLIFKEKNKFKIVSLCDTDAEKLKKYGNRYGIEEANQFIEEREFFSKKRADVLVIATMDADHVRQCVKALELGYDILLEKPITDKKEECKELLAAHKKYGGKVLVCHVLRYAPAFIKTYELINSGAIGRLVAIQALEQVAYWHQAHSYVRGNWRKAEETTPMILAKCCHDLDLLQYYASSKCESISSIGDLTYFKAENAPEGSANRCAECMYKDSCAYSAKRIYIDGWKEKGSRPTGWPYMQITTAYPLTEEALYDAIKTGPYGRCVYKCDNDVVDHQITNMTFENGVKASLIMTAFTANGGRIMKFFGTLGELVLNEEENFIKVKKFGLPVENISLKELNEGGYGHGGGDSGIIDNLYKILCGETVNATSLEASVESHLMGICAEESRVNNGKLVYIH